VSIGATLAAARRHAGLTVADVSHRTRVREIIIEGIEHDDYAACGGDFYARGHIRAIAEAVGTDPGPLIDEFDDRFRSSPEITAADVFKPSIPLRKRERRRVRWTGILAVLVLAVLGFAIYKAVAGVGKAQPAAAASHAANTGHPAAAPSITPSVQGSTAPASPTAAPSTPASTAPSTGPPSPAAQALTAASVAAFGPGGAGSGDNSQQAAQAVSGNPATPWTSDWYATSDFGNLQTGTGLLLDMGQTVTISSVRLKLGGSGGADIQLRAGGTPALANLHTVATSNGADGTVQISLTSPTQARYLLIWFTKLPLDNAGTYQASIYSITVRGQR
jgi:cytoskeletal protein RodZ